MTHDLVKAINDGSAGTLAGRLGITFTEACADRLVATMPVAGNSQAKGALQGGAMVALAELAGSAGASLYAGEGFTAVGVDINATFHGAARPGIVTAVATPLFLGQALATYEIVITDATGNRLCTARITCAIRKDPRATAHQMSCLSPAPLLPAWAAHLIEAVNSLQARDGKARITLWRRAVSRTRTRTDWPTSTQVPAGPLEWLDFRQAPAPPGDNFLRCIFPPGNQ